MKPPKRRDSENPMQRTGNRNHGTKNGNANLTPGQVRFIRYCARAGMAYPRIAEVARTSTSTISRIVRGESWWYLED